MLCYCYEYVLLLLTITQYNVTTAPLVDRFSDLNASRRDDPSEAVTLVRMCPPHSFEYNMGSEIHHRRCVILRVIHCCTALYAHTTGSCR